MTLPLLKALVAGEVDAARECEILDLLRSARPDDLNALLAGVDVHRLISQVDNHIFGDHNRRALLRLLCEERLGELTMTNVAKLIWAMQSGRTSTEMENDIADVLCSVHGRQLTELKNLLASRPDTHDLPGLLWSDIGKEEVRRRVLDHIGAEAASVRIDDVLVMSDVDDTVFARTHETRYPKGALVPGILGVFRALDPGRAEGGCSTGNGIFVGARPLDAFGVINRMSQGSLRKAGSSTSDLLHGDLASAFSQEGMADEQLETIVRYSELFPEYGIVFIGNSGQGDPMTGRELIEQLGDRVKAVIIHDVVDTPADQRASQLAAGVVYVDTYVGAAVELCRRGLIRDDGVPQVVADAREDLATIAWTSDEQRDATAALFERDFAAAADLAPWPASR